MTRTEGLRDLVNNDVSRRRFARNMLIGGLGATAAAAWASDVDLAAQAGITDVDILNFALNLEYLEGDFYTVATSGRRLSEIGVGTNGTGRAGQTVGGRQVSMTDRQRIIAEQIALDEQVHVNFLRAALGSAAVAKPAINLEALGVGFANAQEFFAVARAFEDLGMSAYGGAAGLVKDPRILTAAAQIGLTEAQHVGLVRLVISDLGMPVPLVDALDVPPLMTPNGRLFQVDGNGLSTIRTAGQVLAVAYGRAEPGTRSGAFFPDGVNGVIAAV